jgi:hypothetical protein
MAEPERVTFSFQQIVELLVKKADIHQGYWALRVEFGLGAANVQLDQAAGAVPTALVPVKGIGISRVDELTNLAVDASVVNPLPTGRRQKKKKEEGHRSPT